MPSIAHRGHTRETPKFRAGRRIVTGPFSTRRRRFDSRGDRAAVTLQEVASIAEIAGGFAVVISLIYVGLQLRQNTSAIRSATAQAVHDNYAAWYINLPNDPALNDLVIKGLQDYKEYRDYVINVIMKKTPHPEAKPLGAFRLG